MAFFPTICILPCSAESSDSSDFSVFAGSGGMWIALTLPATISIPLSQTSGSESILTSYSPGTRFLATFTSPSAISLSLFSCS